MAACHGDHGCVVVPVKMLTVRKGSEQDAGGDLGVGEGDGADAQVEGGGAVEGVVGQGGGDFQEAVHFGDDAVAQGDADFLTQKGEAPGDSDFFDEGVFGEGCGGAGEDCARYSAASPAGAAAVEFPV